MNLVSILEAESTDLLKELNQGWLLGLGNERQGLKPALAPLLGSRACPSHREAVRRARRPPAFPSPSPARPPRSGLRERGPGCPLSPPASLQSHHTICQWFLASEHPQAASPLASRMQLQGHFGALFSLCGQWLLWFLATPWTHQQS